MAERLAGYASSMKFKTGVALGFAAGYWAATQASEQTRAQVNDMMGRVKENPRVQRVTDTVVRDARKLGDAVEQKVRNVTDRTTEEATEKVGAPAESAGTTTSSAAGRT
jgi:hypothetical protein